MKIEEKINLLIKNERSRANYLWALRALKKACGEKQSYDSWDVLKTIEGRKDNSAHTLFYMLKKIFRMAGWEWQDDILSPPKVDRDGIEAPILPKELIIETIVNAGKLDELNRAIWALSTVWGMRREEIRTILFNPDYVRVKDDPPRLRIKTAKGGVSRWTLVPPEVIDHVAVVADGVGQGISRELLSAKFHHIIYFTTGKMLERGHGYHSVRRSLIVHLLPPNTTLSDAEVFRFMRWSDRSASGLSILYRYASAAKEEQWFELDQKIYAQHPWLHFWKQV